MTTPTTQPPKRRFEITIKVGGDTLDDALGLLDHFYIGITQDRQKGCAHGGVSAGGSFQVDEIPSMTHERYEADLNQYLETLDSHKSP